jgi:hypothetical protein
VRVVFLPNTRRGFDHLVCEVEILFEEPGPLSGMKLIGTSIWKNDAGEFVVHFPASTFGTGGERRHWHFLRAIEPKTGRDRALKAFILDEYRRAKGAAA